MKYRRDLWKICKVPGNAAEIGVAEGYFSADILSWPVNFPKVYMVDRWACVETQTGDGGFPQKWHDKNFDDAINRVKKYGQRVTVLRGDSANMSKHVPDGSLALLYIDGDHSFEGVMRDLTAWVPKVAKGGVVALHDYEARQYGVKKAVQNFCDGKYEVFPIPEDKQCDAGAYFYV